MADTPLEEVPIWSRSQIAKLKDSWITTAEQVVGIAATPSGIQSLATQLAVSEEEVRRLVAAAAAALPPDVRVTLERGHDTRNYGLGALPPLP